MKKYTDTELLETLLPMLYYSISTSTIGDTVDFEILESTCCGIQKDFVVALQDRINEFAKKARVEATNVILDKDENIECNNNRWGDCAERTYSSKEYYDLMKENLKKDHEITLLKRKVEALEYLASVYMPLENRKED